MAVIGTYTPDDRILNETVKFYELFKKKNSDKIKNDYIATANDFNARVRNTPRVGNTPVKNTVGISEENVLNRNGKDSIDFSPYNVLKIANTLFKHKIIYKYT
jgi:hypothetical protein